MLKLDFCIYLSIISISFDSTSVHAFIRSAMVDCLIVLSYFKYFAFDYP